MLCCSWCHMCHAWMLLHWIALLIIWLYFFGQWLRWRLGHWLRRSMLVRHFLRFWRTLLLMFLLWRWYFNFFHYFFGFECITVWHEFPHWLHCVTWRNHWWLWWHLAMEVNCWLWFRGWLWSLFHWSWGSRLVRSWLMFSQVTWYRSLMLNWCWFWTFLFWSLLTLNSSLKVWLWLFFRYWDRLRNSLIICWI